MRKRKSRHGEEEALIQALERSLAAETKASEGVAPAAAILWPDPERQWLPLVPQLRASLPQLFVLGDYAAEARTGPAIWLRCVVDRTVKEAPAESVVPIFYLPGVSRDQLRSAAEIDAASRRGSHLESIL